MSLVHEALRKAEREKQRKLGVAPNPPPSTPGPPTPQPIQVPAVHLHPPAANGPAAPAASHTPASAPEESREANHFLLPALIGCVAIVAIIAIVFLVSNASSMLRQPKDSAPVAPAAPAAVAKSTAPPESQAPARPPVASPADASTPPSVAQPALPMADESKYKLSGIMNDPDGKRVAVLNGRVAYEGYYIDGATVEKIETDRITIDVKGQKAVLRLY
jgi:hypothetical protein